MIRSRRRKGFNPFFSKAFLALVVVAAGFLSYKVYVVSYEKYQINKQISNLDAQLRALADKGESLKGAIERLKYKDVIEKEARKKLNFVKEGEKAVIITDAARAEGTAPSAEVTASPGLLSNPKKWYEAIF